MLTWEVWLAARNQWRVVAGLAEIGYLGLDHAALVGTMEMLGISRKRRGRVFDGLMTMEAAALPVLNAA